MCRPQQQLRVSGEQKTEVDQMPGQIIRPGETPKAAGVHLTEGARRHQGVQLRISWGASHVTIGLRGMRQYQPRRSVPDGFTDA